ncbi:hypothetical protein VTN02DRAFT_3023 [Thermoascus thermophilus]
MPSKRVAIVGGGCSGVTAFWALRHSGCDVHLFEASGHLGGGRLDSLPYEKDGRTVHVDTGIVLFNEHASPNLDALLDHIGIRTSDARLSFGVSRGESTLQWGNGLLKDILSRPATLWSLKTWQTLFDIIRFRYLAVDVLADETQADGGYQLHRDGYPQSVRDYLSKKEYSDSFYEDYLVPLLSVLWRRTDVARSLSNFPIKALVRFMYDHQLLSVSRTVPRWRVVKGGASQLIQTLSKDFSAEKVHLKTRVVHVQQPGKNGAFILHTADGQSHPFDHIILAVHAEEILKIMHSALDSKERYVLRGLRTSKTVAVLHSDSSFMPNREQAWPTCNYFTDPCSHPRISSRHPCLTYCVNTLQDIPVSIFGRIFITLNPFTPPHPRLVQGVWEYTDAELSVATLQARDLLPTIQNTRGISYCGRWAGHGFYEDAVTSGLQVAREHLGARLPFQLTDHRAESIPTLGWRVRITRVVLRLIRLYVALLRLFVGLLDLIGVPSLVKRGGAAQADPATKKLSKYV